MPKCFLIKLKLGVIFRWNIAQIRCIKYRVIGWSLNNIVRAMFVCVHTLGGHNVLTNKK